jgi:hypothetical protein
VTFAPPLTWMHLLPAGVSYSCDPTVPGWFRDLIRPAAAPDGRPADVRVAFGAFNDDLLGAAVDGLVAVNCRGLTDARLAAAGFGYVRRFAALPNITAARWFIPLDTPAVAAAAFGVYSPTRLSARAKRTAAQLAARVGLPVWYRDSVCIAQRSPPPLERQLAAGLSTNEELRLALSAGAPEPARNRKASAALLRLDGSIVGFAKLAGSPLARMLVEREATVLATLAAKPAVAGAVPRLLAAGEADGRYYLVQSPVTGRAAPARLTDDHRAFLTALQDGRPRPAIDTELVRSLLPRLQNLGADGADLIPACERVVASLVGCAVPSTIVHGDFAPWNLRIRRGGGLAAFDWEYGRVDGLPAVDAAHHELQVGYNMLAWTPAAGARALDAHVADHRDLSPRHVVALQNVYLLDVLARLAEEGYGPSEQMVHWHRDLLADRVTATPTPAPKPRAA